jgi:adenylate cyclase
VGGEGSKPERRTGEKARTAARRLNTSPALMTAARFIRELLPGDPRFGDKLSTGGSRQSELVGRRIAELTEERPGVLREAGLTALQVWQAMSEAQGRGRGDEELAIVFTDLVEFSSWALEAGDEAALELLRDVGEAIEPPVAEAGGEVVKRLGDGMMAVFPDPSAALGAIVQARDRLDGVQAEGYDPHMRAGMHLGQPRKLGGDYLGVDVNIAARVTQEAGPNEVLVTESALAKLDGDSLKVKKKRRFSEKGVPKDLTVYSVSPSGGG